MKEITFNELKKLVSEARGPVEKFYVVAERDNPQLGTFLSNVYVGKKRITKNAVSCSIDYYGSTKNLKFSLSMSGPYRKHTFVGRDDSIYGSMYYYGFDNIEDAIGYLKDEWSNSKNLQPMLAKLGKDELTEARDDQKRFALNVRDYHTGLHNLLVGTKAEIEKVEKIVKEIDEIIHGLREGNKEDIEFLYDELSMYNYDSIEEINWRKIDKNNNYYDPWSEKTYHIVNNVMYDMW